ncbi:MAG: hypothetical protein SGJ01_04705 [Gemmatimonadota bacterium]|nr:hypothetical protein [Gemmatimonadota bacterium]
MNRVMRSTVVLAAALGALSCKGDPTDSLRNGIDHLVATPSVLFIGGPDSTQSVLIEAVDDQGNRLSGTFSLVSATAGLSVVQDAAFNNVYNSAGQLVSPKNWTRAKYNITTVAGSGFENAVFAVGGKQITVPVRIVATAIPSITLSTAAANAGDTVVATAPANFRFTTASVATGTGGVVVKTGISADSSQFSFIVGPSLNGTVSFTNLVLQYAPTVANYGSTSAGTLTSPAVIDFPGVFSNSTPSSFPAQDTVTLSAPGFLFLPTASVTVGGTAAIVVALAADSSSISFVPLAGSTSGPATVNGIVLSFLTSVSLNIPTLASLTVAAASGATALATAPTINIPATGTTSFYGDAGQFASAAECGNIGNHCRFYKLVLAAPRTFGVSLAWGNTADIGGYFIDAAGNDQFGDFACDSFGSGAGGQPEACSQTLPAGTWYLALADFTGTAQNTGNVRLTITGQ